MKLKLSAVLLALLIPSCVDGTPRPSTLVRDSAGVAIVESVGPYSGQNVPEVGSTVFRAGRDQKPGHDFYRVVGATVLAGDRIVADAGSGEIRRFDRKGELVRVVGGLGDGPGEYASLGRRGSSGVFDQRE